MIPQAMKEASLIPRTMKAVVLTKPAPAEQVRLTQCPTPQARPGWVLVRVKAFGLNHSEQLLRISEIQEDYIPKPVIPGIECVGEVADASDSRFQNGQRVAALMGGMGRSFPGSYGEYALLPAHHVFAVSSSLPWEQLAAVPETYFTAWGSLFTGLDLQPADTLLVRGGTCALGYASIQLAKALGCRVVATAHKKEKLPFLAAADQAVLDTGRLAGTIPGVNKVLELVGPKTLPDSLNCLKPRGIACSTGILGGIYGLSGFDPIKQIPNGTYLTGFYSNHPTQEILDAIFRFLEEHRLTPCLGAVFPFSRIQEACAAQDAGTVNGKIVVRVEEAAATGTGRSLIAAK